MNNQMVKKSIDSSAELQITVTGRKTGREHSTPVWFVREESRIYLLPVQGSKNEWYKNVLKSKQMKISSGELSLQLTPKPITEPNRVAGIVDRFRKKHGEGDVKRYYSVFDVAVELTLP